MTVIDSETIKVWRRATAGKKVNQWVSKKSLTAWAPFFWLGRIVILTRLALDFSLTMWYFAYVTFVLTQSKTSCHQASSGAEAHFGTSPHCKNGLKVLFPKRKNILLTLPRTDDSQIQTPAINTPTRDPPTQSPTRSTPASAANRLLHILRHPFHTVNQLSHSPLWDQIHLNHGKEVHYLHLFEGHLLELRHFHQLVM